MTYGSSSQCRLAFTSAAVILLMLGNPGQAWSQATIPAPQAAKKIVRDVQVRLKGGVRLDENRVRSQMSTRVGQPFSNKNVERDIALSTARVPLKIWTSMLSMSLVV